MKILASSQRLSVLCGVCAPPEESDLWAKICQILNIVFIFINLSMTEFSFIMYGVYQLEMGNIAGFLYAVVQVTSSMATHLSYVSMVFQRKHMRTVFNKLQNIFDQCKKIILWIQLPKLILRLWPTKKQSNKLKQNQFVMLEHFCFLQSNIRRRRHITIWKPFNCVKEICSWQWSYCKVLTWFRHSFSWWAKWFSITFVMDTLRCRMCTCHWKRGTATKDVNCRILAHKLLITYFQNAIR